MRTGASGRETRTAQREDTFVSGNNACPSARKCGGCQHSGMDYALQLRKKQRQMEELLGDFCRVEPILGMSDPLYYRNKVHHVFGRDKKGNILAGCYEAGSHRVVDIGECLLEDLKSQEIIRSIRSMLRSFKIRIYDEDSGYGLLRHVLVRRGFQSGEIMVVLVLASPILPGKNNFVKALLKEHPEITTIIINVNDEDTSMVLGKENRTIYGPGFIRDSLCGCTFRISPQSFYQVNPVQTELLYETAIRFAGLWQDGSDPGMVPGTRADGKASGTERSRTAVHVIDAYCGIGTIGLAAAKVCPECVVTGIELNPDAVRDARLNAKENDTSNTRFIVGDAGRYMQELAAAGEKTDIVFMDPPRSGSTRQFINAAVNMDPSRIVYISCGPDTLKRDLLYFQKKGYRATRIQPVDLFPFTEHVETVVLLSKGRWTSDGRPFSADRSGAEMRNHRK